jgi:hypothetical protein
VDVAVGRRAESAANHVDVQVDQAALDGDRPVGEVEELDRPVAGVGPVGDDDVDVGQREDAFVDRVDPLLGHRQAGGGALGADPVGRNHTGPALGTERTAALRADRASIGNRNAIATLVAIYFRLVAHKESPLVEVSFQFSVFSDQFLTDY